MTRSHVAPDGSPVPVYLAMPAGSAPTTVHEAIAADADILELGCGAGRLTRVLVAYGHEIVAVDDDPRMLEHVTGAQTVCADIYRLSLRRRFGAVVVASHLVNRPDPADRARLLDVCARHIAPGGDVLIERYPPAWAVRPRDTVGSQGPVGVSVTIHEAGPAGFSATAEYTLAGRTWQQRFSAVHVDDDTMAAAAEAAGLTLVEWLDEARTWARLRPVGAG
ncbi:class I SAM-dependent methyltransferase [Phytoactinopolyspora mesophila]|uniref:Methyltransferase domain-containing protein n=1 Tax=Phytoactinopolyspora mesophila TaxID=2650750 RepID=A0A7K3M360_9ACTN|nr:class I SAM-dependent methyltransferase [Phytoactinopolyspora mesophila]NDL57467.1 methyltransferase domain-containing protein [Phytoactinopolyspora mesophila]